jgi:hypothetical protein
VIIDPPTWWADEMCPCRNQGGLTLCTCPTCGHLVLICDEVNTVFAISGKRCGPEIGWWDKNTCPECGENTFSRFRLSTSEEIRALGFQPGEYS